MLERLKPKRQDASKEQRQAWTPCSALNAEELRHAQADKRAKHADDKIGQGERTALCEAAGEVCSAEAGKEDQ
jgi:hypothetical protein